MGTKASEKNSDTMLPEHKLPPNAPENFVVLTLTSLYGATILAVWLLWSGM
jgi:hypothetical protein